MSRVKAPMPALLRLEVFENGVPPRFRLRAETGPALTAQAVTIETVRPDGARQVFTMADRGGYLESLDEIPEPHEFAAHLRIGEETPIRSSLKSTNMCKDRPRATTICARP